MPSCESELCCERVTGTTRGDQMAEWLGSQTINQKVVGSIPGRAE